MQMITALTMTITLVMSVVVVPKLYHACLEAEVLYLDEELELLRELLAERNDWIGRHLVCGAGAVLMIWMGNSLPGMEISARMVAALGVYASCSMLFAILESLVAQKIATLLARIPVRVKARD